MRASPPPKQRQSAARFRSKLATYLTGVAIGFALLGFFMMKKQQAVEANQDTASPQDQRESGPTP